MTRLRTFARVILTLSGFWFGGTGWAVPAQGLGSPAAKVGGTVFYNLDGDPDTLHPIMGEDAYSQEIHNLTFSGLATVRLDNYELEPALAERWEVSKDGLTFTFWLRPRATFHDGKPVRAEDVKFSFDAIFDNQFKAFHMRPYFDSIESATVLAPNQIQFKAKRKYFNNLDSVATMPIIPQHVYAKFDRKQNRTIVGSGPYRFVSYDKGKSLILERFPQWVGFSLPYFKGVFNYQRIFYRFVDGENLIIENMKRGQIDFAALTPEQYMEKTNDKAFTDRMTRVKTQNSGPGSYGFVGWNLRNPLFQDRNVRIALTHLMNRELMIKKFLFDMSVPAAGPWHFKSPYASQKVKPFGFDPKRASQLLKSAGWADGNKDGILEKTINGQSLPFRFTLIFANRDVEKYFTIYKEDLRKAGIDVELKVLEWTSFIKLVNEQKFEAAALAWGGGSVDIDPKQIWHTESDRPGGHNFIGYKNPEVDRLIDQSRQEMERSKRIPLLQRAYELIAADAPYTFLFNRKDILYAHNKRLMKAQDTFKYGVGTSYWWASDPR